MSKKLLVIGSTNQDIFIQLPYLPKAGETLLGGGLSKFFGGKGANQAVAIARAGGTVKFITAVGSDVIAKEALTFLADERVDIGDCVMKAGPTATAMIWVSEKGDNVIAIDPAANYQLKPSDVDTYESQIASSDLLVLQMEIPLNTVITAIDIAHHHQTPIILNAAPAYDLPQETAAKIDILVVNETEAGQLTSLTADSPPQLLYRALKSQGYQQVIITLGAQGAYTQIEDASYWQPAHPTTVVDTTGAGDTFVAYLANSIAAGATLPDALADAGRAAAQAVAKAGAMASIPYAPV